MPSIETAAATRIEQIATFGDIEHGGTINTADPPNWLGAYLCYRSMLGSAYILTPAPIVIMGRVLGSGFACLERDSETLAGEFLE